METETFECDYQILSQNCKRALRYDYSFSHKVWQNQERIAEFLEQFRNSDFFKYEAEILIINIL
jgi:hypothetical protein